MAVEDVKLGACSITYNGVNLGVTKGGVEVEVETETYTVSVDQYGDSPIKEYITARSVTVRAPLAETSLANLSSLVPGAEAVYTVGAGSKVQVKQGIGEDLQYGAQKLVLHPIGSPAGYTEDDFSIPLAGLKGNLSYAFKLDEERIFNVEFSGYPDEYNNGVLFMVGSQGWGDFPAPAFNFNDISKLFPGEGVVLDNGDITNWTSTDVGVSLTAVSGGAYQVFGQATRISSDTNNKGMIRSEANGFVTPVGDTSLGANYEADLTKSISFIFWQNWAGVTGNQKIRVFLYHDYQNTPSANTSFEFNSLKDMQVGWNTLTIPFGWDMAADRFKYGLRPNRTAMWTNGGGGAWNPSQGIDRIIISMDNMGNNSWDATPNACHFCGITYGFKNTPVVGLVFDDGYDDIMTVQHPNIGDATRDGKTAYQFLADNGMKATCGIIRKKIDDNAAGYFTTAQLQTLYTAGWDLAVHGTSAWGDPLPWDSLVTNAIEFDPGEGADEGTNGISDGIRWNQKLLVDNGWTRGAYTGVFPLNNYRNGGYTTDSWTYNLRSQLQDKLGIRVCRTSWPVMADKPILGSLQHADSTYQMEFMSAPGVPMEAGGTGSYSRGHTDFTGSGLKSIKLRGAAAFPYFHRLVDTNETNAPRSAGITPPMQNYTGSGTNPYTTAYYIEDLFDVIAALKVEQDAGNIAVMTLSEWYRQMKLLDNSIDLPSPTYAANPAY